MKEKLWAFLKQNKVEAFQNAIQKVTTILSFEISFWHCIVNSSSIGIFWKGLAQGPTNLKEFFGCGTRKNGCKASIVKTIIQTVENWFKTLKKKKRKLSLYELLQSACKLNA